MVVNGGTYEITWTDGSSKHYSNLEKIDQMVSFASTEGFIGKLVDHETPYDDHFELVTLFYAEFMNGRIAGYIDSYEGEYYIVRWSDDSLDKFLPDEDMNEMLVNGMQIPNDFGIHPIETRVLQKFPMTCSVGERLNNEGGLYQSLLDDGSRTTYYVFGAEMDEMVNRS